MNRKYIPCALLLTAALLTAGCGGTQTAGSASGSSVTGESTASAPAADNTSSSASYQAVSAASSSVTDEAVSASSELLSGQAQSDALEQLRKKTTENGSIAAIIDLGFSDQMSSTFNIDDYDQSAAQRSAYPFLDEITEDHIIGHAQSYMDAFCIVPADPDAAVEIYATSGPGEDGELVRGECLYQGDGAPVIVHCVTGDVCADALITVTDPSGRSITDYNPYYSGEDGSLVVTDGQGNTLFDATV